MNYITLRDGNKIPTLGFGVFEIPNDGTTYNAVKYALECGIRHFDTAAAYFNEKEVGQAIKDSGIPREEIWITGKLWLQDYATDDAKKGLQLILDNLGVDYLDLCLLHQPYGKVVEAWHVLEEAKKEGKVRSIGVSNFTPKFWNRYTPEFNELPAVVQAEFHPYYQQKELRKILGEHNVALEAWSPLGRGDSGLLKDPVIVELAEKYGKDVGQIIIRFINQEGIITFPRSTKPARIKSNMDIFDFTLSDEDMERMRSLDKGAGMHDPNDESIEDWLMANYDIHKND